MSGRLCYRYVTGCAAQERTESATVAVNTGAASVARVEVIKIRVKEFASSDRHTLGTGASYHRGMSLQPSSSHFGPLSEMCDVMPLFLGHKPGFHQA
eukprot:397022-Amphidinium_carterae.1